MEKTALVALGDKDTEEKVDQPKKNVLDEDSYAQDLEKIIVRDFFPDLPRLQAQSDYLDALQCNDVEKLRLIHIKYGPKRPNTNTPSIYSTPATFETPESRAGATPQPQGQPEPQSATPIEGEEEEEPTHNPEPNISKKKLDSDLPLDRYLAKNTSEDNASFAEIMVENEKRHKQKHAWLYEMEEETQQESKAHLALPSIEKQAITGSTSRLQGWNYLAKNSLMYVPDGVDKSAKEEIDNKSLAPRIIVHDNTRYHANHFNMEKCKETIQMAASVQALNRQGKIGPDGKEMLPDQSPSVNGYGFMATPSPAPGVGESPLMTWGEIEGSPFRLDGGDTPVPKQQGPVFRIPQMPKRDRIGMELSEKASKAHRMKKQEALKRVTARLASPSQKFGMSKTDRLNSMSPAAQRLASSKLGIRTNSTDKALRASYTPSPSHKLPGDKTPIQDTPTPGQSSKSAASTPKSEVTPKRIISEESSLTDNLLNLPKRVRAEDFF